MAKTGSVTASAAIKFGGRKGANTAPHADYILANGQTVFKPGDSCVKQMSMATWTPRHMRGAR